MMDLSFQEKSLWLTFVSLVAVFAFYFGTVLPTEAVDVVPQQVVSFILAIVMLVIIQIGGHAALAIADRRTDSDERDRLIRLKGSRNAGYVLATGVFLTLCSVLISEGNFLFTHVLLASWVLAQLVETGSQLLLYRRGA